MVIGRQEDLVRLRRLLADPATSGPLEDPGPGGPGGPGTGAGTAPSEAPDG